MIYKFKSKATADLIMTGPVGDRMLGLIGKTAAAKGIIEPAAMPAAVQALEAAVAADEAARQGAASVADETAGDAADRVTLRQHAWPMIEMLKRAHAQDAAVVWGV